jgi:chromosome segregation ATPase
MPCNACELNHTPNIMFKSQEIADLQARISTLEASLKTETEGKATLQGQLDQAKADLTAAQSQATDFQAAIDGLNAQLKTSEELRVAAEDKATKAEASINDQVTSRLAAAGVNPIARDPQAKNPQEPGVKAEGPPLKRAAAAMAEKFGGVFGK